MILLNLLLSALIGTVLIEGFSAFLLGIRDPGDLVNISLANLMTNPFLVMFSFLMKARYGNKVYYPVLFIMEVLAVICEAYIYQRYLKSRKWNPFLLSLILNVLSFSAGLLFTYM